MAKDTVVLTPNEAKITAAVMAHWRLLGRRDTLVASIPNLRSFGQPGLTRGLPDLIVMGSDVPGKIAFVELKSSRGKASEAQLEFAALCAELGIKHAFAVGRDEPIAILEAWGVVRRQAA